MVPVHSFLCMHLHHAYSILVWPKKYEYSTLAHRAGVAGDFFLVSVLVHFDSDLPELFFPAILEAFSNSKFTVLFLTYFDFSSDIKRIQYRTGNACSGSAMIGYQRRTRRRPVERMRLLM